MIDPHLKLIKSLNDHGVDYLLIGGMLAIAYGVPRTTKDIDFFIRATEENAQKILEALQELGFGTSHLITAEEIAKTEITILKDYLRVDLLTQVKGLEFDKAFAHKEIRKINDISIFVLTLEDLILSKKAAGRPGDLEDVCLLEKIQQKIKEDKQV